MADCEIVNENTGLSGLIKFMFKNLLTSLLCARLFNEVQFFAAKEWISRAPAVVDRSLSGMDTSKLSDV
jgi:hypothetical protein